MAVSVNPSGSSRASSSDRRWEAPWAQGLAIAVLILAGISAYHGSLSVPFLFDDDTSIFYNPTIRHLWPPWGMLAPPSTGAPVTSRPVANISLALNYAIGG